MGGKKHKGKGKGSTRPSPRQPHPKRPVVNHNALRATEDAIAPRFSLRDEAQWASGHRSNAFMSGKQLRNLPIAFVSAGLLQGTIEEKPPSIEPTVPSSTSPLVAKHLAEMTIRSSSPSPSVASASSNSSEEVIVFKGRGETPLTRAPLTASVAGTEATSRFVKHGLQDTSSVSYTTQRNGAPSTVSNVGVQSHVDQLSTEKTVTDTLEVAHSTLSLPTRSAPSVPTEASKVNKDAEPAKSARAESDVDSDSEGVIDSGFKKRRGDKPIWEGSRVEWTSKSKPGIGWLPAQARPDMDSFVRGDVDRRAEAMDDYAQNVQEHGFSGEMLASFTRREMDLGSHNDWVFDTEKQQDDASGEDEQDGWDSDLLRDLDGNSTSTDVENVVARIIRKRTRVTGIQYLVVYEGSVADDARWLPVTFLKTPSELELIRKFETRLEAHLQAMSSGSETDANTGEEDQDSEEEDEEELDDETIARVLQKQEELGLGSEEVLLYAADEYFGGPVNGRKSAAKMTFSRPNQRRQFRAGGGRRSEPTFPSASAMADALDVDAYDGFDVMDTNRPSLRPRKKGRRGQIPPELEDADLNEQIHSAWEADRAKKRLKKAEREQLRQQGLLGRKGKAPDLSAKYKGGFDMTEVKEEIHEFMASNMQTLSLPPMEAHYRALIHQSVGNLGLNSKSRGIGTGRFTVLSKTSRMPPFDDDFFDSIFDDKKFMNRWAGGARGPKPGNFKDRRINGSGRPLRANVGYKDGEIVGASAPELGPENRGRALLEKMGWSKGMALGATDNKGILQPIAHVVKTNKAGLQ
ncbi:hypothetical protein CC80DRAFT_525411 [Byssothecium circinans]|uniref:Protein SQS1 n=1 Tax=Byssothecium circinans TaxID=147558 RepID=A0A6A5TWY0_9PLEO|nr:hypothetical protein CC80DRAFT_525411 [Byssothecium circinans]